MILFGKGMTTWFRWGVIHITKESYDHGLFLGTRSLACAFLGILFPLTTKPVYLFYSLMQQLRLKPTYAYSFMAGIRLIPMIVEEFQIIKRGVQVRGIPRKRGVLAMIHPLKLYVVPLFAHSIRRAYRIAIAMEAKRFTCSQRTFYYQMRLAMVDFVFLCFFLAMMLSGIAWSRVG
jgi:energy-coupling factor transport system permease protein